MMKRASTILGLAIVAAVLCSASVGLGAESEGEHAPSPSIFSGNLGDAFWTLLIFGAVIFVLGKFAWKPVLGGLQKREQFIHDSLEQARTDREQAEKSMKEHAAQLEKARSEASSIVEEGRRDAEVLKRALQDEAKKESDAMISRARKEIDLARDSAVSELYNLTADLAADAAGRIIRRQLSPADHAELVRESIEEIRSLREGNGRGAQN